MNKKITSLKELKELSLDEYIDIYIQLISGLRSSKRILYRSDTKTWDIYHGIDDVEENDLRDSDLNKNTNIIKAIENGNLYKYE